MRGGDSRSASRRPTPCWRAIGCISSATRVAVVVARDPYIARDAVDAIEVDYDPLPVVTDPEAAARSGSPLTHPDLGTNVAFTHTAAGGGDIDEAFRRADRVIKHRLYHQRLTPMPIEPRGVVASYHAGEGTLTLWTSTQIPHLVRTLLPGMIGIPENKLRIIAPEVGGGFGAKLNVYAGGGAVRAPRDAAQRAGEMDRIAARERGVHHPRPRSDRRLRGRRQERRHHSRHPHPDASPTSAPTTSC